jgi:hypothetical protein
MTPEDLYPTKTRLALLRDIADGKVCDGADGAPHLDIGDGETARVADAVWAMERAGWVTQPSDRLLWELTATGHIVLDGVMP